MVLTSKFFNRPTCQVAKELLGKFLVRNYKNKLISLMICEVEAYDGPQDLACHARVGKTTRTDPMFGSAGHFYVYFVYGVHWMLNIVTGPNGYPSAVLIRGAGKISGPARLTKFLKINKSLNTKSASKKSGLWIEDRGVIIKPESIISTPRIGVSYAGPYWSKVPYRFVLDSAHIHP
jgi:DNA-3-methyladenine glycosylase